MARGTCKITCVVHVCGSHPFPLADAPLAEWPCALHSQANRAGCPAWHRDMMSAGKWTRAKRRVTQDETEARSCQPVLCKPGKFNKVHPLLHVHRCFPCFFVRSLSTQWLILKALIGHPLCAGHFAAVAAKVNKIISTDKSSLFAADTDKEASHSIESEKPRDCADPW